MVWMPRVTPEACFQHDGNMAFPRAGTADQHHVLGPIHELTAMELTDQGFTDFAGGRIEAGEILVGRKAGGFHVIGCRAHLAFGNFGLEQLRQDRRRAKGTLSA